MNTKTLEYFITAAKYLNFRKAAEMMHIEQSTLSKHISRLESDLGCQLFIRSKQSVSLSDQGKVFLEESQKILESVNSAKNKIKASANGETGVIKIGFRNTMSTCIPLYKAITAFRKTYPLVELQLNPMMSIAQCEMVLNDKLDIAICYSPPEKYEKLERLALTKEYVYLAIPTSHPYAELNIINARKLRGEKFIGLTSSKYNFLSDKLFRRLRTLGLQPEINQFVDDDKALIGLVALGMGVTFILAPDNHSPPPGLLLKPIENFNISINLEMLWLKNTKSVVTNNFTQMMLSTLTSA